MESMITPSYFHLIPSELLEGIVSYLNKYSEFEILSDIYYIFYKLADDILVWKRLLKTTKYANILQDFPLTTEDHIKLYYDLISPNFNVFTFYQKERPDIDIIKIILKNRISFKSKLPFFYEKIKDFPIFNPIVYNIYDSNSNRLLKSL